MIAQALFDEPFLRAQWGGEFEAFEAGLASAALRARLRAWTDREQLNERASETAFIQRFFVETWGYKLQGEENPAYTCRPQFEVAGAGQAGGTGFADLALGNFGADGDGVPQVLCEFKDIRSGLDARQARKANNRSPVEQCFDYLQFIAAQWRHALRDINITEAFDAKRLLKLLLNLRTTSDGPLRDRILALDAEITNLDQTINDRETTLNRLIYGLYDLTPAEIAIVEAG
jgi:hypothetical protein